MHLVIGIRIPGKHISTQLTSVLNSVGDRSDVILSHPQRSLISYLAIHISKPQAMDSSTRLPPTGIHPIDQYYINGLSVCRTASQDSLIIYPERYRPSIDPEYEDPAGSVFAWQNQGDAMEQLGWLMRIYEIMGSDEPKSHSRVQK